MDIISELLEEMATTSIALNRAIDKVKNDRDRFLLFDMANAIDYDIHEIRKHTEKMSREHTK